MGKPYLGVKICLGDKEAGTELEGLLDDYRRRIGTAISWAGKNMSKIKKETDYGIYLLAGERISEHILSNVISVIHKNNSMGKPLLGFSRSEEGFKISARARDEEVASGINLKVIMDTASREVGGEGGGHAAAAGASIPESSLEAFIAKVDNMLAEALNKHINMKAEDNQIPGQPLVTVSVNGPEGRDNIYGKAGPEKVGAEREGKGENPARKGSEIRGQTTGATHQNRGFKKVEGKGLVQYFSP